MSRINGEKARAAIARKNRTARRQKDRARLAEIKAGGAKPAEEKPKTEKKTKKKADEASA
jgi:hypothetical protein